MTRQTLKTVTMLVGVCLVQAASVLTAAGHVLVDDSSVTINEEFAAPGLVHPGSSHTEKEVPGPVVQ